MSRATYRTYEPISLCAAEPGWRAVYIHEPDEGGPGWSADPLIAWAVYDVTTQPVKGSSAARHHEGKSIHGVIFDDYAMCPEEIGNFWRYLAPGQPDPTPEEVAAEQQASHAEAAAITVVTSLLIAPSGMAHYLGCPHKGDHPDYSQWGELDTPNAWQRIGSGETLKATGGQRQDRVATTICKDCNAHGPWS